MAAIDDLKNRRDEILTEIARGTTEGGEDWRKINASADGETVDYATYRKSLYEELKLVEEAIARADDFEIHSIGG